jgi:hypothetical protein
MVGETRQQVAGARAEDGKEPKGPPLGEFIGRAVLRRRARRGRNQEQAVPKQLADAADLGTQGRVLPAQTSRLLRLRREGEKARVGEAVEWPARRFEEFDVMIERLSHSVQRPADARRPVACAVGRGLLKTPAQMIDQELQGRHRRLPHDRRASAR